MERQKKSPFHYKSLCPLDLFPDMTDFCYERLAQGSKLAVVCWSGTTKKSNGPAQYKFQWSDGPVIFNFSFFLSFFLITIRHA